MSHSLQLLTPNPTFSHTHHPTSKLPFPLTSQASFPLTPTSISISNLSLGSHNGGAVPSAAASVADLASSIEVDAVTETELKENGFRSTRRTKLVCTIGPASCGFDQLQALAVGGMNVARINMCHGTREWHKMVIEHVRRLNQEKGFAVAIMMDTEGSEIHMGDLGGASSAKAELGILYCRMVKCGLSVLEPLIQLFPSAPSM